MNGAKIALANATIEDFQPFVGERFDVSLEEAAPAVATLTLRSATSVGRSGPEFREPFSLVFEGPPDVHLQQQIFWLTNPQTGTMPIFLVAISGNSDSRRYEAVFN